MSYALGLGAGRPAAGGHHGTQRLHPDGRGLRARPGNATGLPVAIGHGTQDPVIGVEFGHDARDRLTAAGADVTYRESPMPHADGPGFARELPAGCRTRSRGPLDMTYLP